MRARALYVAFDVYPRPKGSSSHIASMLAALAGEYGSVCVLCLGDAELPEYESAGPLQIHRLPAAHRDLLQRATAFAQFVAFHAARHAEWLELMVFRDPWGGVPAIRAVPGCKAIFEVNALPSWELAYSRPGFADSPTLGAKLGDMERYCLRKADAVLCVSAVTRSALEGHGVDSRKITVIPNASADVFFQAESAPCPIPALAGGDWCAYVGGLQGWQGVDFLIDALALASNGRLLIVPGGTRGVAELERRIGKRGLTGRVLWSDPLSTTELAGVFSRVLFTVAPLAETARNTWQGCCPVKIVESMASGTPVLASDLAVSRELIEHGETGWLAPPGDKRAWALAVEGCFADPAECARVGRAARRRARESFRQPAIHARLREVFRMVTAQCDILEI